MAKTRFWGRFEQESGFAKSKMPNFFKWALWAPKSKSGQNLSKSTKNCFFCKIEIKTRIFRYEPLSDSKKPKS